MKNCGIKTALITGASSGIGAAFARELASQGYALVLVARREDRLKALAAEIHQHHGVRTETLIADLSCPKDVERVGKRISEVESLELLINNAGFGTMGVFSEVDLGKQIDMIWVHVITSVRFTRAVLPGMIAGGRGAVINVSSIAAFIPTPGNATYSATKAYLNAFAQALNAELRGTGVKVQALCPGFTFTEFHDTPEYQQIDVRSKIPKVLWMGAEEVVGESLKALERNQVVCIPGFKNRLIVILARCGLVSFLSDVFFTHFRKWLRRGQPPTS